jgi:hypothetical protein
MPNQIATVHMFDLWANHHDERQRVYRRAVRPGPYTAFFVDNGHLFGGPSWLEGTRPAHRPSFLYPEECLPSEQDAERAVETFEACIPTLLQHAICRIPRQWYEGDIVELSARLLKRLACLRSIIDQERRRPYNVANN